MFLIPFPTIECADGFLSSCLYGPFSIFFPQSFFHPFEVKFNVSLNSVVGLQGLNLTSFPLVLSGSLFTLWQRQEWAQNRYFVTRYRNSLLVTFTR
jgi:hypothetical protein